MISRRSSACPTFWYFAKCVKDLPHEQYTMPISRCTLQSGHCFLQEFSPSSKISVNLLFIFTVLFKSCLQVSTLSAGFYNFLKKKRFTKLCTHCRKNFRFGIPAFACEALASITVHHSHCFESLVKQSVRFRQGFLSGINFQSCSSFLITNLAGYHFKSPSFTTFAAQSLYPNLFHS